MDQAQAFPRPLTARESAVLNLLVNAMASRPDTSTVQVTGMCGCGCPTIYFTEQVERHYLLAEALGPEPQPSRPQLQVLLFGNENSLDSLELVFGEDESEFPAPETLSGFKIEQ